MNRLLFLITTLFVVDSCAQVSIDIPEITKEELHQTISFLASDSLKGRKPGTPEGKIAAEYIASQLASAGFKPLADEAFQYFEVITEITPGPGNALSSEGITATAGVDFVPFKFSANTEAEGSLAFCGFGFNIETEDIQWNDFEKTDVDQKWAIILRGDPEPENPDSKYIPYSGEEGKVINAKDQGAIGVLFVSGIQFDKKDELAAMELDQSMSDFGIPVFHIKRELANRLLAESEETIESLEKKLMELKKPFSFNMNKTLKGKASVIHKKVNTQNVVMWMEGADKELKNEFVLIGGHYDHLGLGGTNSGSRNVTETGIHYGADDNASGVASVIEVAEKMASERKELKRSLIVMAFGAEEIGLLGSKYFTANPLVELEKLVAVINIDMVGRLKSNRELLIGGTGTAIESESLLDSLIQPYNLVPSFSPNGFGPSDHASFYAENIPVFFFSTGAHSDYHTPRDVVDSINFDGLVELSNYIYDLGNNLTNRAKPLTYQEAGPKGRVEKTGRKSKVKLGIMPNFGKSDNNGLRVDAVTPQCPAYLGGMQKGDVITAIDGKEVHNIYEYMERMNKLRFGQTISVDILRDGQPQILLIQLEALN